MPFFPLFFPFLSQTDPSQPFALLGCAPGTPRRCINPEPPGPPMVVPAFSWNSLIHQHSYEISCRKDFFIGCDKNPGSGGSRIGAWMSGNQNHPFWGCFSFLFCYGRQIPNHQLPGSTKMFASSLIFPVEPSHFHSTYPLLIILWDTSHLCFSIIFSVLSASQEVDSPQPQLHWAVGSGHGSHFQPFLL